VVLRLSGWALVNAFIGVLAAGCTTTTDTAYEPYAGPPAFVTARAPIVMPTGDVGIVTNSGSDTISVLDLDAARITTTFPVGRDPLAVDGPHHITIDPSRRFAYVGLQYPPPIASPGPISARSPITQPGWVQKISLLDGHVEGEVKVDVNPGEIVMTPDGARLVVTHYDLARALRPGATLEQQRANLAIVDPNEIRSVGSAEPTFIQVCIAPHGTTFIGPDARFAYVACYGEDVLAIVDLSDPNAPVVRIPMSDSPGIPGQPYVGPYAAIASHDGKRVAVGDVESKDVRFLDVASRTVEKTILSVNGSAFFPAFSADDARLYVPTQGPDQIVVGDTHTGLVINARTLGTECRRPHEAQVSTNGSTLYVVCEGDHVAPGSLVVLDANTLATKATLTLGIYPDRLILFHP
jgi:DNA-binding beta-propeller fold protein YncE